MSQPLFPESELPGTGLPARPEPASPGAQPGAAAPAELSSDDAAQDTAGPADAPGEPLAEAFARAVLGWADPALAPDARERLRQAARALSLGTSEGHVCVSLQALCAALQPPCSVATLVQDLHRSGVAGSPQAPGSMPLIVDLAHDEEAPQGRLYLHRYFDLERRLARRVAEAARTPLLPLPAPSLQALRRLFPPAASGADVTAADWQQLGAALALMRRLTVISGGPGTGKTTTVVNLLAGLIAARPGLRIALAAPTGKAAARMTEALRERARALPPQWAERLPTQGFTLHRLLGWQPDGFRHHRGNPLPLDVLVVDEASMLDIALATRLLEAVPPEAHLVLLGDKDQLAAVEAGAVFADLSADPGLSEPARAALAEVAGMPPERLQPPASRRDIGLRDTALWFTRSYRFDAGSPIGRLAADIRDGREEALASALAAAATHGDDSLHWIDDAGPRPSAATLHALLAGFEPYVEALLGWLQSAPPLARHAADAADPVEFGEPAALTSLFAAFDRFRVLCATRQGPRGVDGVNAVLAAALRRRLAERLGPAAAGPAHSAWFAGRPVMVLRNDEGLRLFNGDIGLALPQPGASDGALRVVFPSATHPGGFRSVSPARLSELDTAFAMTVHKSQGSEFDGVLVLLPAQAGALCTRELLYTAVTRARRRVTLAAGLPVLQAATRSPTRRQGGFAVRLREAMQAIEARGD